MKNQIIAAAIVATSSLLLFNGCKKTVNQNNSTATVLSTIKNDPTLTIYSAIETRSADDALFGSGNAFLVPDDNAFISAGISSAAMVANLSQAKCDSIVRYYTIANGISFGGNANKETAFTTALSGTTVYGDSTSTSLYFNGMPAVSVTPVSAGGSVIYELTQVLNLPVASVSQMAATDPDLSMFNEALVRTNFAAILSTGSFTLFIPTNSAFINAGYPDIASIDAADVNTLTQILQYHVVVNDLFTNDLGQQTSLTTLEGGTIQLNNINGTLQLLGNSDPNEPASVVNTGVVAGNVLAYKITQVLLP